MFIYSALTDVRTLPSMIKKKKKRELSPIERKRKEIERALCPSWEGLPLEYLKNIYF